MELDRDRDRQATALLEPLVRDAIRRIGLPQFSTKRLIETLRGIAEGEAAYENALQVAADAGFDDAMAHYIVHGQIIPAILRGCELVRFGGFIHGAPAENDGYGVPSRWRLVRPTPSEHSNG